ncbi:MAG: hypothetical protein ABF289_07170 [Clostridiales bacterium]
MSIFEIIMLICFGAAWPFSIIKSYKAKNNSGKSLFFLFVILLGYLSGIMNKLLVDYDKVILLYILNFVMVFIDILIYLKNRLK